VVASRSARSVEGNGAVWARLRAASRRSGLRGEHSNMGGFQQAFQLIGSDQGHITNVAAMHHHHIGNGHRTIHQGLEGLADLTAGKLHVSFGRCIRIGVWLEWPRRRITYCQRSLVSNQPSSSALGKARSANRGMAVNSAKNRSARSSRVMHTSSLTLALGCSRVIHSSDTALPWKTAESTTTQNRFHSILVSSA